MANDWRPHFFIFSAWKIKVGTFVLPKTYKSHHFFFKHFCGTNNDHGGIRWKHDSRYLVWMCISDA